MQLKRTKRACNDFQSAENLKVEEAKTAINTYCN
ncbi:MAG: hypothetical protein ACI9GZ_003698 [Bacteroidia bacterium]